MIQVLNSLIVTDNPDIQPSLEGMMNGGLNGYVMNFMSSDLDSISKAEHEPDIIFIESDQGREEKGIAFVTARYPGKTYVILKNDATAEERRYYMSQGVDEVLSPEEIRTDIGKHLLERLIAYKRLLMSERKVEQSEERFRGIIEHSHDIIMLLDHDGTIIYTSPAFERQLGYEPWEVLGQEFYSYVHEEDRLNTQEKIKKLSSVWASDGMAMSYRMKRSDGIWRDFETIATNLLNTETVQAIVLNSRDMTELKRTENALEKERELVEQQRTFISMVSHEFRTPLTIIDGNAQILGKRGLEIAPGVLESRTNTIRAAVQRLVTLIETILSVHAIESGKLSLSLAPCDVLEIIEECCQEQREVSKGHKISFEAEGDIPKNLVLDQKITRHIIANILSNAVKYSAENPVVDVTIKTQGNDIVVCVKDYGVGIPASEVPRLFQKYFRASTSGGIPGSGLGLSLVKQFVELHNGSISLKSEVGEWTEVIVRLPMIFKMD